MNNTGSTYKSLANKFEETLQQSINYKEKLSLKEGFINTVKNLQEAESLGLRLLLEDYREEREKKVCFIHPMLYEDCLEQINRLTLRKREMTVTIDHQGS